jgi:hypothetical protein
LRVPLDKTLSVLYVVSCLRQRLPEGALQMEIMVIGVTCEPKPGPRCYTCGVRVEDAPGVVYCDACVAKQLAANGGTEREAFDGYHAWADRVARGAK